MGHRGVEAAPAAIAARPVNRFSATAAASRHGLRIGRGSPGQHQTEAPMKIITLTLALALAVIPAMVGSQASAPTQQLVAFDVDLDAGTGTAG
jgi:hypothetical protein